MPSIRQQFSAENAAENVFVVTLGNNNFGPSTEHPTETLDGPVVSIRSFGHEAFRDWAKRERGGDCVVGKASLKFLAIKCSHCR